MKVCDVYCAAQFGKLLSVLDRKISNVRGLNCIVQSLYRYVIGTDIHPPESVLKWSTILNGGGGSKLGKTWNCGKVTKQRAAGYLYEIRTGHFTNVVRTPYRSGSPFWPPWVAGPGISNAPGLRTASLNVFRLNTRSPNPVGRFSAFVFLPPPSTCRSYVSLLIPPRSH
jgi:hypothetical protein